MTERYTSEVAKKAKGLFYLAYDHRMLLHACLCHDMRYHPERPDRLPAILKVMAKARILDLPKRLLPRVATFDELLLAHTEDHVKRYFADPEVCAPQPQSKRGKTPLHGPLATALYATIPEDCDSNAYHSFGRMPCGGIGLASDTAWNPDTTPLASQCAVGSLLALTDALCSPTGDSLRPSGFALLRPPGHHAECDTAMGFCFYNNVAVAAKYAQKQCPSVKKVAILDWDVHHGNGTQRAFYEDESVLYISIHRYGHDFYPGFTGGLEEVGEGKGERTTVNIPLTGSVDYGDAEYCACIEALVIPILKAFGPDLVQLFSYSFSITIRLNANLVLHFGWI